MNADWDQFGSGPGEADGGPSAGRPRRRDEPAPPLPDDVYAAAEPTLYPFDTSGSFEWSPPVGRDPEDAAPPPIRRERTPMARPVAPAQPVAEAASSAQDATTPYPTPSNAHSHPHSRGSSGSAGSGAFYSDDSIEFVENPMPGMEFDGTFRFVRQIGKGGMGSVWEVTRLKFNSPRALKLIVSKYVSDPHARKRFDREAKIMEKLRHPHAVTVYSFKMSKERAYIEMELLSGQPLNKVLTPGRGMPADVVGRLVDQLCDVLQAAHDAGIIHRDIKPANVFLVRDEPGNEFLKVLDFGIAKLERPDSVADHDDEALTLQGAFLGTVHYASPEQIEGRKVDHRSDIYSVGVILYELLTGYRPYSGVGMEVGIKHVAGQVPRFADRAPGCDVPEAIEEVVRRCMAKSPSDRFSCAAEISEAFRKALERSGAVAHAPAPRTDSPGEREASPPPPSAGAGPVAPQRGGEPPTNLQPVTGGHPRLDRAEAEEILDLESAPDARAADPRVIAGNHPDSVPGGPSPLAVDDAPTLGTKTRHPETATDPSTSLRASRRAAAEPESAPPPRPRAGKLGPILGGVALMSLGVALALAVPKLIDRARPPAVAQDAGKGGGDPAGPEGAAPPAAVAPAGLPEGFEAVGGEIDPGLRLPRRIKKVLRGGKDPVEITFILIPGGKFPMGTDDERVKQTIKLAKFESEFPGPVHEVKLSRFYIQETEVTNAQFEAYLESAGRVRPADRPELWVFRKDELQNAAEHPAVGVGWEDARGFARWVSPQAGDLPTEAQWEYVARSLGDDRMFVGRSQPDFKVANIDAGGVNLRNPTTTPVRQMSGDATEQEVLGMAGNVREWCRDVLCEYNRGESPPVDPCAGPDDENILRPERRVIRGGSYRTKPDRSMTFGPRYPQPGFDIGTLDELATYKAAADIGFRAVIQIADGSR